MQCEECGATSKMTYDGAVWSPMRGPLHDEIAAECELIRTMLQEKNAAYGNSAIDPIRVFSQADPTEQLKVRIDDKLSRWVRGGDAGEDVIADLIGYLILLRIAGKTHG